MPRSILPRRTLPPIWRELSHVARCLDGIGRVAAPGGSASAADVLLIPGFLSGDRALAALARALTAVGHTPAFAGIRLNVDCSEATLERLVEGLEGLVQAGGAPVALVGHSRGGLFARVLAVRRPDLVSTVVTLGAPHRDQLAVHPILWATAFGLAATARLGVRGVVRFGCASGSCCGCFEDDLVAPLPAGVRAVAVYSRRDGVVDWRACLDPWAHQVEVAVSHLALISAPDAHSAVLDALPRPQRASVTLLPTPHERALVPSRRAA